MCWSKPCQLLQNKVGTSRTTNPQRMEVMESEDYSQPTCNKLCVSSHDALDHRTCNRQARLLTSFYRAMLCIRGTSHGSSNGLGASARWPLPWGWQQIKRPISLRWRMPGQSHWTSRRMRVTPLHTQLVPSNLITNSIAIMHAHRDAPPDKNNYVQQ